MASILKRSINAKPLPVAGLSCISPDRAQGVPMSLHVQLLRIPILSARVSTHNARLKTVSAASKANGRHAIIDWHSLERSPVAADSIMNSTNDAYSAHLNATMGSRLERDD
jgi:hypothetical protein